MRPLLGCCHAPPTIAAYNKDMDRYFIGIAPPPALTRKIASVQQRFHKPALLLQPLQPHITLLHPNSLYNLPHEEFLPKVKALSQKVLPLEIKLQDIGVYGQRVLHMTVESTDLKLLQEFLIKLLPAETAKEFYEGRPYTPHITIAQTLRGKRLPDARNKLYRKKLDPLLPMTFIVNNLTYYEWLAPRHFEPHDI
jgi:2'-5' RNA ligase